MNPATVKSDSLLALEGAPLYDSPFPFIVADQFFSDEEARMLQTWFERDARWWLQLRNFYIHDTCENMHECPLAKADGPLSPIRRSALAELLSERFGTALERDSVTLGAHRMKPGAGIGIHTDNPELGTESVRLLVTLGSEAYEDSHGGHLCLFSGPHRENLTTVIRPTHNAAVAFALSNRSYHAVNDVTEGVRHSLVYGFWAEGTSPKRGAAQVRRRPHRAPEDIALRLTDGPRVVGFLTGAGARGIVHSGAWLLDHLLGVASILLEWDSGETIARAGLYHSV
ncbi:MAG: 2OG-Fe(II) oxygenase, partial [Candidatus Eremiobacteraeota bacterium]|nr:2OG-Fe(II) oxygenase [Candidatus Eremiobacteraeota bacterium]